MATIKNTTAQLGNLINQINGQQSQPFQLSAQSSSINIDDDSAVTSSMLDMPPVFEMNYKSVKKQCIKKAKDSITKMVNSIVPLELQNSDLIQDKINQDAEQLGCLYYEYEKNDKVVQALMETIARGELQAKLFEVYAKFSKINQELSAQITNTQNQFRKYYIDTYQDVMQKSETETAAAALPANNAQAIEAPHPQPTNQDNIIVGTEDVTKMLNAKKRQALIAEFEKSMQSNDK